MTSDDESARSVLRRDRWLVTVAAVVWLGGTAVGTGLVGGGGVAEQGEGLFSDSATLIAPHGPAFSIWSVIYVGLAGYAVWQWLPASSGSRWARVTRVPAAASMALNGVWLLVVFAGWSWVSVVVMAGIVVSLGLVLRRTSGLPGEGWPAQVWVSVTFGLYLGWIAVATCANVAAALVGSGVEPASTSSVWITVAVLGVVVLVTLGLARRTDQPWFRAGLVAAVAWGTSWIAVGRFTGDLRSDVVAWAAVATAVLVLVPGIWLAATASSKRRVGSQERGVWSKEAGKEVAP